MKKYFSIKFVIPVIGICLVALSSCKKNGNELFDNNYTGIYFQADSNYYSFGVTPLEVGSYDFEVPVRIMGRVSDQDRTFKVEVIADKTNAESPSHYSLTSLLVKADSVNGYVNVKITRNTLGKNNYKLTLKLVENEEFAPTNDNLKETRIYFNNNVDQPSWKDWQGKITWPSQLGKWNPVTYVKFIELFRNLENVVPATYAEMVKQFGPDLKNVTYGWAYDFDYTLKKYVLTPLYDYLVAHPELGATIPKPY